LGEWAIPLAAAPSVAQNHKPHSRNCCANLAQLDILVRRLSLGVT
jgi:hypothetical protein